MIGAHQIRREMPSLLRLAVPIVMGEVGWMSMNFVDVAMIGRVGPTALAAVSLGSAVFIVFAIVCEGMMMGSDAMVSQDFGAGRIEECFRTLWAAAQLALPLGLLCALLVAASARLLRPLGIAPEIVREAIPFLYAMACGLPALMGFVAMRVFLQVTHRVRVVAFAMVSANLVNLAGNYALIYGHWGLPALGATGSGLSTALARCYMMCVLLGYMAWRNRREHWRLGSYARRIYPERMKMIVRRGGPAAAQIALEVGVFSAATLIAGRLGAVAVSGHQIALILASLTFMVPLGVAQATSVRVGNAIGRGDAEAANVSGWSGVALSASFMSCSAVVLWTLPRQIVHIFTDDPQVVQVGVSLLAIAAVFQFFDGVQVTTIGAMRGSGNTRIALLTDFVGWWLIGLPVGVWLCFGRGWGVRGLWVGLSTGLISIACVMALAWSRRVRWLRRELRTAKA
jgi:MATE family multidrug resistance protein